MSGIGLKKWETYLWLISRESCKTAAYERTRSKWMLEVSFLGPVQIRDPPWWQLDKHCQELRQNQCHIPDSLPIMVPCKNCPPPWSLHHSMENRSGSAISTCKNCLAIYLFHLDTEIFYEGKFSFPFCKKQKQKQPLNFIPYKNPWVPEWDLWCVHFSVFKVQLKTWYVT